MPIILGDTTISGLAAGGLPSASVTAATLAANAVIRSKMGYQGAIIQTVHNFTDATGVVGDVSTWLETFITPQLQSSRILVMGTLSGDYRAEDNVLQLQYNIGGGTWQLDGNLNSRQQTFSGLGDGGWQHKSNGGPFPFCVFGFFHPNTTAQVGIRFRVDMEGGSAFYLNRSRDGQDNSENFGTGRSVLILSEVRTP
jgi:hypothetical protein